ncbi:MAG: DUF4249 domain-containing protein [Paludibacter sp.]|jgi:hypothetical protein
MKKFNIFSIFSIFSIFFLSILLLNSCEKEIEFSNKITDPLIVVNSIITPDSIISANITKSKFFLANNETFDNIENADVSVFVNGTFKEKMSYSANGKYMATFAPNAGDVIELKVKVNGMPDVNCQTVVSQKPDFISIDTTINNLSYYTQTKYVTDSLGNVIKIDTISANLNFDMNVKIRFHDNANEINYYRLSPKVLPGFNNSNSYSYGYVNVALEGVLSDNNDASNLINISGSYNYYNIFSDEIFNGKEFTLTCTLNCYCTINLKDSVTPYLYIDLQNINSDYYKYLYTRSMSSDSSDPFTEKVQIYSNVNGGIGILGAYNNGDNSTKINLLDLLKKAKSTHNNNYGGYNMKHKTK